MPVFVKIFNIIFESRIVPDSWSEGYICPIFKNKGDPANADNYRGITIISCYILKRQTSRFHYGSKVPAVTITVFITTGTK
jgi:hypothetical protein